MSFSRSLKPITALRLVGAATLIQCTNLSFFFPHQNMKHASRPPQRQCGNSFLAASIIKTPLFWRYLLRERLMQQRVGVSAITPHGSLPHEEVSPAPPAPNLRPETFHTAGRYSKCHRSTSMIYLSFTSPRSSNRIFSGLALIAWAHG